MRITRGWHGHVANLRVRLHVLLVQIVLSFVYLVPPVCLLWSPTCHGQFLSRRICFSSPIARGLWGCAKRCTRGRRGHGGRRQTWVARTGHVCCKGCCPAAQKADFVADGGITRHGQRSRALIAPATHSRSRIALAASRKAVSRNSTEILRTAL